MEPRPKPARSDDALPYDRELIRSGGVTSGRQRDAAMRSPAAERPRSRPRPAARPRRSGGLARALLLLLVAAVAIVVVLVGIRAAAFHASVSSAPFVSSALFGPLNGDERVNVLLVGYGGAGHDGAYLADSIQILSIDAETDTTTTIPIPRDLWLEGVESFARSGKVNEVFAAGYIEGELDGAGALLSRALSEVTGLDIQHWMSIDFAGFRAMVDAVGGVTVENPTAFCWTTGEDRHRAGQWDSGCFDSGLLTLDGEAALMYSRARYTSVASESTDFARSARQSRVIGALRSELGDGGIGAIGPGLSLMDAMEGNVHTDLSAIDLFLLSSHFSSDRRVELTEGPVLTATTNTVGQYILIPTGWTGPGDYDGVRAYLDRELATSVGTAGPDAP
ncbi:MAG TPA: LCP family protein [Candidatus Limnocylindria bacterium]|nr:LCP family protein [Candidatus Limnocylindria bacterium]